MVNFNTSRLQLFEGPQINDGFRWFENHRRSWSEIQSRTKGKYGANEFWHWTGDRDFGRPVAIKFYLHYKKQDEEFLGLWWDAYRPMDPVELVRQLRDDPSRVCVHYNIYEH